ncbi:MAG: hypothetical protein JXR23_09890 [Pontiellaceae bacterium]|nr:hypothetical protein [Pontiellaceae bacterium]
MKKNIGCIFVDDGYPEAEEYETNYVAFEMQEAESYRRAEETANSMLAASRNRNKIGFRGTLVANKKGRLEVKRNPGIQFEGPFVM